MVTASNIGSGKKVNVGQSFAEGMSALQTVQKEKFIIVDESGTKKDALCPCIFFIFPFLFRIVYLSINEANLI